MCCVAMPRQVWPTKWRLITVTMVALEGDPIMGVPALEEEESVKARLMAILNLIQLLVANTSYMYRHTLVRQPQWKKTSMEDDLNGRWSKWKTTLMEENLIGRRPQWQTTSMEDDLNGRWSQWKMILTEYDLNGRQPQWKTNAMEDDLNGRKP